MSHLLNSRNCRKSYSRHSYRLKRDQARWEVRIKLRLAGAGEAIRHNIRHNVWQHMILFWNGRRTARWTSLKFRTTYGTSLAQLLQTFWPNRVRSWTYNIITGALFDRPFSRIRVFSSFNCCHRLEWKYYAWFRSDDDRSLPLTSYFELSKVIRSH